MKRAAVSVLKAHLSEFLETVKAGEEILVTARGRPVARIIPLGPREHLPEELLELERRGVARVGTGLLSKDFWDLPRPSDPDGRVRAALMRERGDDR
jgi:prevent-host-death family protein